MEINRLDSHPISAAPPRAGGKGLVSLGERTRTRVARPEGQQPAQRAVKPPTRTNQAAQAKTWRLFYVEGGEVLNDIGDDERAHSATSQAAGVMTR